MAERSNGTKPKADAAGRVAPHNLEAEESLLGAMLLSADARNAAVGIVAAGDFYRPTNADVFDAIVGLHEAGEAVDAVSVDYELRHANQADSVGGPAALLTLQANVPSTSSAGRYAEIVRDLAVLRRLIGVAGEVADAAYATPDDVAEAVLSAAARIEALLPSRRGESGGLVGAAMAGWLDDLERRAETGEGTGTPSGWRDLDRLLVGVRTGQLVIVGARPSVGKSQVLLGWAYQVAVRGVPALLMSAEMTEKEVHDRLVAWVARVDREEIRRGQLREASWMRMSPAMVKMADLPLWVEHDPDTSVSSLRAAARRVQRTTGREPVVLVDYAQLMQAPRRGENRQAEMAELSRALKRAAAEWPIVAASQLSRKVEERGDRKPQLSDLRETGAWEQDADVVVLLHRPDAHDRTERPGEMDLIVAKQRNGPTGTATLLHDRKTGVLRDRPEKDAAEPLAMPLEG